MSAKEKILDCNLGKKDYYKNFDDSIIKEIISLQTGTDRLRALGSKIIDKPLNASFIHTLSGIRDWTRILRKLKENGEIDYIFNKKEDSYTFKKI